MWTVRSPRAPAPVIAEALETRRHFALSGADLPRAFGGDGFDAAQKIVTTADGGYVMAGLFSGTVDFGSKSQTRTAQGDTDVFVARYRSNGSLQWVQTLGGPDTDRALERYSRRDLPINPTRLGEHLGQVGDQPRGANEYINDLAVDSAGNVFLAGAFRNTIQVGSMTLTADQSVDANFYDALVAKIDAQGTVTWARQIGGAFEDNAFSIAVDASGTPIIGGYYGRSADFDPTSNVYRLQSPEGRNAGFVARLSPEGGFAWAYQFTSDAIQFAERNAVNDIAVTPRGDVYFAGIFSSTVDFAPGAARYEYESEGRTDAVFGRLSRKGEFQWAIPVGGEREDGFNSIALDPAGHVYTAGYFSEEVDVDPRRSVTRIFTATPEEPGDDPEFSDILISKWAADGKPLWQAQMGGGYYETVRDLQIGPDGSVYTVGSFFGDADFAPNRSSQRILSSIDTLPGETIRDSNTRFSRDTSYDWYVSRLSPRNGSYINAARFGGQDDDFGASLAVNSDGQIVLGGRATTARGERDDRHEQSLVYLLTASLNIL